MKKFQKFQKFQKFRCCIYCGQNDVFFKVSSYSDRCLRDTCLSSHANFDPDLYFEMMEKTDEAKS